MIQRNYIILTLLNTLSASFIWGINTLFLLDAGLSNTEAFAVNAFFTAGMVLFEIPTGVIADTLGRQTSFLMGTATLILSTILYYFLWQYKLGFIPWALASLLIGLGFTFFSGAVEAWLVDALNATGFKGKLDDVFAKGQITSGIAMLTGATLGGYIAQISTLGVPYLIRTVLLVFSFLFALYAMKDIGFEKRKIKNLYGEMKTILKTSLETGFNKKSIRYMILTAPFISGTTLYAFYAAQPYIIELYGKSGAYSVAGLLASIVAGAQIIGGILVPFVRKGFKKRTSIILFAGTFSAIMLILVIVFKNFWWFLIILALWSLLGAISMPIRSAYLNKCLPSNQRATLLSFDGLVGSTGGVVFQPLLGRAADLNGYAFSFLLSGLIQLLALPFLILARKQKSPADEI